MSGNDQNIRPILHTALWLTALLCSAGASADDAVFDAPFEACAYGDVRDLEVRTRPGVMPFRVAHCAAEEGGRGVSYYRLSNHPDNDFPVKLSFCPGADGPVTLEVRGGRRDGERFTVQRDALARLGEPSPCTFVLAPAGHPRSTIELRVWAEDSRVAGNGPWVRELGDVFAFEPRAYATTQR